MRSRAGSLAPPGAPEGGIDGEAARWATAFALTVHRARWIIVAFWTLAIAVGFVGTTKVAYDPDVLVYFDPASEARQDFDAIAERFGRAYEVVTLVVPKSGDVFTPQALRAMASLTLASQARAEVQAVRSPLTRLSLDPAAVVNASDEALAGALAELETLARDNTRSDVAALIPSDGSIAAVAAIVDDPVTNAATQDIARAHRALRDRVTNDFPNFALPQTGRIVIDDAFLTEGQDDVTNYFGLQIGVLSALLFAAFGSLSLVALFVALEVAIAGGATGVLGWSGIMVNGISSSAPAVLMGLMVATAVHIAVAWQDALRGGATRTEAVALAYTRNLRPVLLSVLTTMISFLILNGAESPPFRQLGNIVALGLVGVLVLAFTLLPALLTIVPASDGAHRRRFEASLADLGAALVRRRRTSLAATAATAVLAAVGVASITIDDTFSHYFDERYEVRRATDLFEARLSGTTIIDIAVDLGRDGQALAPPSLERAAELTAWLRARPEVARVDTPATLVQRHAEGDGATTPAALRRTQDEMVRQGVPAVVDPSGRHIRYSVVMRGVSSRDTLAFADALRAEAGALYGADAVVVTGMPVLSAGLSFGSARAMVVGMGTALAAISLVIVVALRSVRLGLVSLMPNLLPIAVAFGLWGVFAGEVSFAATVVGALTYGIVVDDTVHILAKIERLTRAGGLAIAEAVRATFRSVGVAVVVTSLALALSFLPFALSGFLVNRHFGALTALTLLAALVADLLFLPALLAAVDRWRGRPERARAAA